MGFCHLCGEHELLSLLDFGKQPISHRLLSDPCQEEYVHPVIVCICDICGLIQLSNPIPSEKLYKEYQYQSGEHYQPHMPRLVSLIEQLPGFEKSSRIQRA